MDSLLMLIYNLLSCNAHLIIFTCILRNINIKLFIIVIIIIIIIIIIIWRKKTCRAATIITMNYACNCIS